MKQDLQLLGSTVKYLVVWATRGPKFVNPCKSRTSCWILKS